MLQGIHITPHKFLIRHLSFVKVVRFCLGHIEPRIKFQQLADVLPRGLWIISEGELNGQSRLCPCLIPLRDVLGLKHGGEQFLGFFVLS